MGVSATIVAQKRAPASATVIKAFSKYEALCDGNLNQEREVPAGAWINAGLEWHAIDAATAQANWQDLRITVAVDGQEIADPKRYTVGPYPMRQDCPEDTVHEGFEMALELYLPPLGAGEHRLVWTKTFERRLNDGWETFPQGETVTITSTLRVRG